MDDTSPATDADRPQLDVSAGTLINARYRLEGLLATAQRVQTWRAIDQTLSRPVIIHLLHGEDERVGWVLAASRQSANLSDGRLMRVLDALEARGQDPWAYVVVEHPVGETVQSLAADGPLTNAQISYLAREMFATLAPLHARMVFHRRLNPSALMVTSNGQLKMSGLLVDSALRPRQGEEAMTNAQKQIRDLFDAGRIVYCLATGLWPVLPSQKQRHTWGLPPAPLVEYSMPIDASPVSTWAEPHQLNPALNPDLSRAVMALLKPATRLRGPSIATADEAWAMFNDLPGTDDAEQSLETLMATRHAHPAAESPSEALTEVKDWSSEPTDVIGTEVIAVKGLEDAADFDVPEDSFAVHSDDLQATRPVNWENTDDPIATDPIATQPMRAISGAAVAGASASPAVAQADDEPSTRTDLPAVPAEAGHPGFAGLATGDDDEKKPLTRRFKLLLVAAVILLALLAIIVPRVLPASQDSQDAPPDGPPVASAQKLSQVFLFDPPNDGGRNDDNPSDVPFAADGDPTTLWRTQTYGDPANFGDTKRGVGVVYDFGSPVTITTVKLLLENQPNAVQLMVPTDTPPEGPLPMESVDQWTVVAANEQAGLEVILTPEEPIASRWVMVYFTSLPPLEPGKNRTGIAETYFS